MRLSRFVLSFILAMRTAERATVMHLYPNISPGFYDFLRENHPGEIHCSKRPEPQLKHDFQPRSIFAPLRIAHNEPKLGKTSERSFFIGFPPEWESLTDENRI